MVADDGNGGPTARGGGLTGLTDRVGTVDGRLDVQPARRPTVVTVDLPIARLRRTAAACGSWSPRTPLLREGLVRLLDRPRASRSCAAVGDARRCCAAVAEHRPDVAVVDIRMPPTPHRRGTAGRPRARQDTRRRRAPALPVHRDHVRRRSAGGRRTASATCSRTGWPTWPNSSTPSPGSARGGTALDPEVVTQLLGATRHARRADRAHPPGARGAPAHGRGPLQAAIAAALVVADGAVEKHVASIFDKLGLPRPRPTTGGCSPSCATSDPDH